MAKKSDKEQHLPASIAMITAEDDRVNEQHLSASIALVTLEDASDLATQDTSNTNDAHFHGDEASPAMTTLILHSAPAGATVRIRGGKILGVTPFSLTYPQSKDKVELQFVKQGFRAKKISVGFENDDTVEVQLRRHARQRKNIEVNRIPFKTTY